MAIGHAWPRPGPGAASYRIGRQEFEWPRGAFNMDAGEVRGAAPGAGYLAAGDAPSGMLVNEERGRRRLDLIMCGGRAAPGAGLAGRDQ